MSRNYAYQVLLLEEFARHGAEVVFLKAPAADTPEQRLLLQFQGMIAEYERAQISERTRRGKRYRAKAGVINVLSSSAPYGYRYVRKTQTAQAYYEVVESEAEVVRKIFKLYTVEHQSMRGIVTTLNAQNIPTRYGKAWVASTLYHLLKNPAYEGRACYGKTEPGPPSQRSNRIRRLRGIHAKLGPVHRPRPPQEWIAIAVPPLVNPETFAFGSAAFKTQPATLGPAHQVSQHSARFINLRTMRLRSLPDQWRRSGQATPLSLLPLFGFGSAPRLPLPVYGSARASRAVGQSGMGTNLAIAQ